MSEKLSLAHVPAEIFIQAINMAFSGYAIEKVRIENNRLLGDVGVYRIFTTVLCDWSGRLIRVQNKYFRVGQDDEPNGLRNLALLVLLRETCDKFLTHSHWLNEYEDELATVSAPMSEAKYQATCWRLLDMFGQEWHDFYKGIEPRINADTKLFRSDYEHVHYMEPGEIRAFTDAMSLPPIVQSKHLDLKRYKTQHWHIVFDVSIGYAPEIDTIYYMVGAS